MRRLKVRQVGDIYMDKKLGKAPELEIRLKGRWISKLGIKDGDNVLVYETNEGLEIKREKSGQ